ncbi:MAG TPA: hypothetical protein VIP11_09095, partial [Gemmatimonadaceae bacterium]
MFSRTVIALAALLGSFNTIVAAQSPAVLAAQSQQLSTGPRTDPTSIRFEIAFGSAAHATPVTGRVYVMLSKTPTPEPRTT